MELVHSLSSTQNLAFSNTAWTLQSANLTSPAPTPPLAYNGEHRFGSAFTHDTAYILSDLGAVHVPASPTNDSGSVYHTPIALAEWFKTDNDQLLPVTAKQLDLIATPIGAPLSFSQLPAIASTQATLSEPATSQEASPSVSASAKPTLGLAYVCRWSQYSIVFSDTERLQ